MTESGLGPERQRAAAERWAEISARPTALYRLFDTSDTLLYVGITCNLEERWKDHAQDKRKPWWPQVSKKTFEWHEDRRSAERAEIHAIATEKPRYNVAWAHLHQGIGYRLGWLRGMLSDEERTLRTPCHTPRSKRGK